jgi:hypothetical protein
MVNATASAAITIGVTSAAFGAASTALNSEARKAGSRSRAPGGSPPCASRSPAVHQDQRQLAAIRLGERLGRARQAGGADSPAPTALSDARREARQARAPPTWRRSPVHGGVAAVVLPACADRCGSACRSPPNIARSASVALPRRITPCRRSVEMCDLWPKTGIAMPLCSLPSGPGHFTVRRASVSFWRALAGLRGRSARPSRRSRGAPSPHPRRAGAGRTPGRIAGAAPAQGCGQPGAEQREIAGLGKLLQRVALRRELSPPVLHLPKPPWPADIRAALSRRHRHANHAAQRSTRGFPEASGLLARERAGRS